MEMYFYELKETKLGKWKLYIRSNIISKHSNQLEFVQKPENVFIHGELNNAY